MNNLWLKAHTCWCLGSVQITYKRECYRRTDRQTQTTALCPELHPLWPCFSASYLHSPYRHHWRNWWREGHSLHCRCMTSLHSVPVHSSKSMSTLLHVYSTWFSFSGGRVSIYPSCVLDVLTINILRAKLIFPYPLYFSLVLVFFATIVTCFLNSLIAGE